MLPGQQPGRSPHFFLSSEVGECYSSWLASQGKLNAQKAPAFPGWCSWPNRSWALWQPGHRPCPICSPGSTGADVHAGSRLAKTVDWTQRVGAKPTKAEKPKALRCSPGPHIPGGCNALRSPPPASQHDCTSKKGTSPNPPPQQLPSLSTLPCGSLAERPFPAVSLRLSVSPEQSPS